jgi:hypothetical protein
MAIKVSPELILYVCGVAVGPIGAGVGATNDRVSSGVAAVVGGRSRSTAFGWGVRVAVGGEAAAQALNAAHNAATARSARNLSRLTVLTRTL